MTFMYDVCVRGQLPGVDWCDAVEWENLGTETISAD